MVHFSAIVAMTMFSSITTVLNRTTLQEVFAVDLRFEFKVYQYAVQTVGIRGERNRIFTTLTWTVKIPARLYTTFFVIYKLEVRL